MAKSSNQMLLWGGVAAGAYFLWKNKETLLPDAVTDTATQPVGVVATQPSASTPLLAQPLNITPTYTPAVQTPWGPVIPSNFTQPQTGPVATCMQRKPNWSQSQCTDRLAQLQAAYKNDLQQIAFLQSQLATVPNAVDVSDGQAELAKYQAAIAAQSAVINNPATDATIRANYQQSVASLQQGVNEIQARIAAKQNSDPKAAIQQSIATWKAAADGHRNDYYSFTGIWL